MSKPGRFTERIGILILAYASLLSFQCVANDMGPISSPQVFLEQYEKIPVSYFRVNKKYEEKNAQDFCLREAYEELGSKIQVWAVDPKFHQVDKSVEIICKVAYFENKKTFQQSPYYLIEKKLDHVPLTEIGAESSNPVLTKVSRLADEPFIHIEISGMEPEKGVAQRGQSSLTQVQGSFNNHIQIASAKSGGRYLASAFEMIDLPISGKIQIESKTREIAGHLGISSRSSQVVLKLDPNIWMSQSQFLFQPVSKKLVFPKGFKWGITTSGHQIEGGNLSSDWYSFEHGESDHGPDHWNRVTEDIKLLKKLGVTQYRMTIEWSRVQPREGIWNLKAAEHYLKEIDLLQKSGIEPIITLQHSTLPLWVSEKGGWEWEKIPQAFTKFAVFSYQKIAPRVRDWVTVNEPLTSTLEGYIRGIVPPGKKTSLSHVRKPVEGILKSHASVYAAMKKLAKSSGREIRIGMVHKISVFAPASGDLFNQLAAKAANENYNWAIPNALKTGKLQVHVPILLNFDEEIPGLKGTQDFFGLIYCTRFSLKYSWGQMDVVEGTFPEALDRTEVGLEMYPEGFYEVLKEVHSQFPEIPILVLEESAVDGTDRYRAKYIHDQLVYLHYALEKGIPIENYSYRSLYDSFEWDQGFNARVGLYEVDFKTKKRIPRPSAEYYREIVRKNALSLD